MGFDISYHPVDVSFIKDRVIPYVRGTGSLDDVLPDMIRIERVRHRVAGWAYQVQEWSSQEWQQKRQTKDPKTNRPPPEPLLPAWFDSDLHVWGRPFFITVQTPEEVSEVIDRYCAAHGDKAVDELVREQIALLNPQLVKRIKAPKKENYSDAQITRGLLANLDLNKSFRELAERGEPYVDEDGEEHDARNAFAHSFPLAAVAFAAVLRPGWMARGHVWPTLMLANSGLLWQDDFEKPSPLFKPVLRQFPEIDKALEPTIVCNYVLGGYVRPARVKAVRKYLRDERETIIEALEYGSEELQKIDEALYDAIRRKLAFVEAAEIYSGIMGIMN